LNKVNDAIEQVGVSVEDTLKQRGSRYGTFSNGAKLIQKLKHDFHNHVELHGQSSEFSDSMREAVDMILHKLARIANGDPTYDDTWRDIAGYAQLIVEELNYND